MLFLACEARALWRITGLLHHHHELVCWRVFTPVKRGQPVLINYKWPTTAWDEIESGIVGLCAWEAYDGGQGLGTEGGAFVEQLVVALRRGGIGAMMLRTVRRSGRAAGGRVELQVHDKNREARRYYRRLGNASNTVVGVARRALEGRRGGPMRAGQGLQNHASGWGGA